MPLATTSPARSPLSETREFTMPAFIRHKESFAFPLLPARGVFVVEVMGGGRRWSGHARGKERWCGGGSEASEGGEPK